MGSTGVLFMTYKAEEGPISGPLNLRFRRPSMSSRGSGEPPGTVLKRGMACINCRRRKMRCDGVKPVCGQCTRSQRSGDCEYTDSQVRTRTQMLEDEVSRLKARIRELENPEVNTHPVQLYDPYQRSVDPSPPLGQSSSDVHQYESGSPGEGSSRSSMHSFDHASTSSSEHPSWQYEQIMRSCTQTPSSSVAHTPPSRMSPLSPTLTNTAIVDRILSRASNYGFFLSVPRFRSAMSSDTMSHHTLAVLNAIQLLGSHLSDDDTLAAEEPKYLSQALQQRVLSVSTSHPQKILYMMQADILLAQYFFRNCKFIEGWTHLTSAASLSNGASLHQLRNGNLRPAAPPTQLVDETGIQLPPPRDMVDEGERINAFWTIFIMDKCWSIALNSPSSITDVDALGTQVYTPWPLEADRYEMGFLSHDLCGERTLQRFLVSDIDYDEEELSSLASVAKASLLLDRAGFLNRQWKPNASQRELEHFYNSFVSLWQRTDRFIQSLSLPGGTDAALSSDSVNVILAHSIAHFALLKMHSLFTPGDTASKEACIRSARAILDIVREAGTLRAACQNPIMPVLWQAAGQIIVQATKGVQTRWGARGSGDSVLFNTLLQSVVMFGDNSTFPLMRAQLRRVQSAMASA